MESIIIYSSMTGHSKKIANQMADSLNLKAYNIKEEKPEISECDLLFIVSGIYGGKWATELLEFSKSINNKKVKRVVLITSSMRKAPQKELRLALTFNNINVDKEEYLCEGGFLFFKISHPNKNEIDGAVTFAKNIINS